MKFALKRSIQILAVLIALTVCGQARAQLLINGAGATFPYPIYSKWFDEYTKVDPSVRFNSSEIFTPAAVRSMLSVRPRERRLPRRRSWGIPVRRLVVCNSDIGIELGIW
jgi:hypothetical protein